MPSVQKNRGMFPGGYNAGVNIRPDPDNTELGRPEASKKAKNEETKKTEQRR